MFCITKIHLVILHFKSNFQEDYNQWSCLSLFWYVVSIFTCISQAPQVLVLCWWHELLHGCTKHRYEVDIPIVPKLWSVQEGTNLTRCGTISWGNMFCFQWTPIYLTSKSIWWKNFYSNTSSVRCNIIPWKFIMCFIVYLPTYLINLNLKPNKHIYRYM
jgi:hypothetical protein